MRYLPKLENMFYAAVIICMVIVSSGSLYFIGVNTFLADRVLPRVHVANVDVSLLSAQDMQTKLRAHILTTLPGTLHIQIDNIVADIPTADLNIQVTTNPLQYGKGGNIGKVFSQAAGLISGVELPLEYSLDPEAIMKHLPIKLGSLNPARVENGVVRNCESKEFQLDIDENSLTALAIQALSTDKPLNTSLSAISTVPQATNIVELCGIYNEQSPFISTAVAEFSLDITAFELKVGDPTPQWTIRDEQFVRQQLVQHAQKTDQPVNEGKFEFEGNKVLLLQPYTVGRKLNIDQTITAITNWLQNPTAELSLVYDTLQPAVLGMGKEVLDFTKRIASGKTRIDIIRGNNPNWVLPYAQYGLEEMNNMVIPAKAEFSYIDTIKPQPGGWTQEGRPIGAGICNSTTTLFRAALEAGFPITDRSYHPTYIASYEWGYPLNIVDAAYLTEPRVDMKFINDLDYPILLKFSYVRPGDNWQYHTLDVYTSSQAPDRRVELKNFQQWNVQSQYVFEGSFDRFVYQGESLIRQDNFYSRYI